MISRVTPTTSTPCDIAVPAFFTKGADPYEGIEWTKRDAVIANPDGSIVFKMEDVEAPASWSQLAVDIAASKYFRKGGVLTSDGRNAETSVRQLIDRVALAIGQAGADQGYFGPESRATFEAELKYLLVRQMGAFNSPVWFNCFSGRQRLITREFGSVSLAEVAGQEVMVWTREGWRLAQVKSFGNQRLQRITFAPAFRGPSGGWNIGKTNRRVSVEATSDHRWLLGDGSETTALKRADAVLSSFVRGEHGTAYTRGFRHGVIFGDGTSGYEHKTGTMRTYRVRLCGPKSALSWAFERVSTPTCYEGDTLASVNSEHDLKSLPGGGEGDDYLRGFVDGWIATDGSPKGENYRLSTVSAEAEAWLAKNAALSGWLLVGHSIEDGGKPAVFGDKTYERSGPQHCFVLSRAERAWKVISIEPLGEEETVFCAVVPDIHEFTLSSGIVTGNCGLHESYGISGSPSGRWAIEDGVAVEQSSDYARPGVSACFIQTVDDDLMDIADHVKREMRVFKSGGGSGANYSSLRGAGEPLSGGGSSSGVMSFLDIFDKAAGATKSGGTTRRAARLVALDADHPDVEQFIAWKADEEKKAAALIEAGWSGGMDGEAVRTVGGQNANNSVRVTDAFMQAVLADDEWELRYRTTGKVAKRLSAKKLMHQIAEAAWACGDPGLQYHDAANKWNTVPQMGCINGANPCNEFVFIDNSACNLAALNLVKFVKEDGAFDETGFSHACRMMVLAQEILVDYASYPTEEIAKNTNSLRPLGLGFTNIGGLLMRQGIPYNSDEGRAACGAITALMAGSAWEMSAEIAGVRGPFSGFAFNRDPMLQVARAHHEHVDRIDQGALPEGFRHLKDAAGSAWRNAIWLGEKGGFRNSQLTLLAPTGTTGLLMDCDTTGIEPDFALVKLKKLAGGGTTQIINRSLVIGLKKLGYSGPQIADAVMHVNTSGSLVDAPHVNIAHYPIFDCASGKRAISPHGHLSMMAAAQPFLSGAISKCVTGETLVTSGQGLVRIADLYQGEAPDSFRVVDIDVASIGGSRGATSFYYGGEKAITKLVLGDGRQIRGTDQHRVRVATPLGLEWKCLPDIEPGEFICIALGAGMWGADGEISLSSLSPLYGSQTKIDLPQKLDPQLALMLGMLTADGHIKRSNYTVGLTKNDSGVLNWCWKILKDKFGLDAKRIEDPRNGVTGVEVYSKSLVEWLDAVGFSKERVPALILSASEESVRAYLSGLYLDGWIAQSISIGQKYRSLLLDVQAIWDNLSVHTYFTDNVVDGVNYPVLHVAGGFRRRAVECLDFMEKHKRLRAADLGDGEDRRVFPMYRGDLQAAVREARLTTSHRSLMDPRTRNVRFGTARRAAEEAGVELPDEVWSYTYVPVTTADTDGAEPVYDLSVPETEAFVANGIMNHNTVNLPNSATVEEIEELYVDAWRMGIKCVAVYRNGSKLAQALSTLTQDSEQRDPEPPVASTRRRLPKKRRGFTQEATIGGHKVYLRTGEYEDGTLGEIFIDMHKEGATLRSLLNMIAIAISLGIQHGVPLAEYVDAFTWTRFQPSGPVVGHANVKMATSLIDYIFKVLGVEYLGRVDLAHVHPLKEVSADPQPKPEGLLVNEAQPINGATADAEVCTNCGGLTQRTGTCAVCTSCGETSGCG